MSLHAILSDDEIRMIQALADFQMALSAVDFMCELDEEAPLTRIERRRHRCYEDAAVVSYWRPFSQSKGLPSLSLKKLAIKPTGEQLALHTRLKERRNEVVAHTDADRMRLGLSTFEAVPGFMMPRYDFDDSLAFFDDRWRLMEWLRVLRHAAGERVAASVQGKPPLRFLRDHLIGDSDAASNTDATR